MLLMLRRSFFHATILPLLKMAVANSNLILSERVKNILRTHNWPARAEAVSKLGFQIFIGLSWFESHSLGPMKGEISYFSFAAEVRKLQSGNPLHDWGL